MVAGIYVAVSGSPMLPIGALREPWPGRPTTKADPDVDWSPDGSGPEGRRVGAGPEAAARGRTENPLIFQPMMNRRPSCAARRDEDSLAAFGCAPNTSVAR